MKSIFSIALLTILLKFTISFGQKDWQLAKEKNGIKVFSKTNVNNGLKELKTEFIFKNTSISTFFSVFTDVENCGKWTKDLKYSKILKQLSETETIEYYQISVPWPFQNRDVIYNIKYSFDENDKSLHLKAKAIPTYIKEEKNVVRIEDSYASWKFTKLDNGNVKVENHLYANPKGFPAWIVNMFAVDSPFHLMTALQDFIRQPQHQNRAFAFIKE